MNEINVIEGIHDPGERQNYLNDNRFIDTLNEVKEIWTIGATDYTTMKFAADYFEVEYESIRKLVQRHRSELEFNGLRNFKRSEVENLLMGHDVPLEKTQRTTKILIEGKDPISVANAGLVLIPKRALLNIGMLLTESQVAIELRRRMLDIVMIHTDETIPTNTNADLLEIKNDIVNYIYDMTVYLQELIETKTNEMPKADNTEIIKQVDTLKSEVLQINQIVRKLGDMLKQTLSDLQTLKTIQGSNDYTPVQYTRVGPFVLQTPSNFKFTRVVTKKQQHLIDDIIKTLEDDPKYEGISFNGVTREEAKAWIRMYESIYKLYKNKEEGAPSDNA